MEKEKCAVIGLGWWGKKMIEAINLSSKFRIASVFDVDRQAMELVSNSIGCYAAKSFYEILNDANTSSVFILSPNQFHASQAIAIARARKNIFIEKPLGNNISECKKIIQACKRNKVVLAVGHNVRRYSIFKRTKELIFSGVIGEVVYIDANRSRPIGHSIDKKSWRYYRRTCTGGPLLQMGIHLFDTIRYIQGFDCKNFEAMMVKKYFKTQNAESFLMLFRLADDCLVHAMTSYVLQETFYINFFGTKGTLFVDAFNGVYLQKHGSFSREIIKIKKNNPEVQEVNDFYVALRGGKAFEPCPEEALLNVKIIERILRAK